MDAGGRAAVAGPPRLTPSRIHAVAVALQPGRRPALLAWAADLDLGRPPGDAFTRSRRPAASPRDSRVRLGVMHPRPPAPSESIGLARALRARPFILGPIVAAPSRFPVGRVARRDLVSIGRLS